MLVANIEKVFSVRVGCYFLTPVDARHGRHRVFGCRLRLPDMLSGRLPKDLQARLREQLYFVSDELRIRVIARLYVIT
jgi:hypothetical protein